jgi:WD40 repeat protein
VPVVLPRTPLAKLEPVSSRLVGELIHPNRESTLAGLRFSPDGKRLLAGDDPGGVVVLWDVASGNQLTAIETGYGYRSTDPCLFVTPDWKNVLVPRREQKVTEIEENGERTLEWKCDGDVRVWDLSTGRLVRTYKHSPPRGILGMLLAPDGSRFVTFDALSGKGSSPPTATSVWHVSSGHYRSLPPHGGDLGWISPDGRTLATRAKDPDGKIVGVALYDLANLRQELLIKAEKGAFIDLGRFSPDGRMFVAGYRVSSAPGKRPDWDSWFKWYDAATGKELASFPGEKKDSLFNARFSPDGRTIAAVSWGSVPKKELYLFDVPTKKLVKRLVLGEKKGGRWTPTLACMPLFSPDGKSLAFITQVIPESKGTDWDPHDVAQARIHLIDVASAQTRETLIAPQGFARAACFSPDGKLLATGGLGRVMLWDMSTPPGSVASQK